MKRKPPLPFLAIAAVCIAAEAAVLLFQFKALAVVRIALYSLLLFLAIRGSRGAAEVWGLLSIIGGALTGYGALKAASINPLGASLLASYAAFLLLSAAYIFKSRSLAEYFVATGSAEDAV